MSISAISADISRRDSSYVGDLGFSIASFTSSGMPELLDADGAAAYTFYFSGAVISISISSRSQIDSSYVGVGSIELEPLDDEDDDADFSFYFSVALISISISSRSRIDSSYVGVGSAEPELLDDDCGTAAYAYTFYFLGALISMSISSISADISRTDSSYVGDFDFSSTSVTTSSELESLDAEQQSSIPIGSQGSVSPVGAACINYRYIFY